jgi:hypothetical protein
MRQCEVLEKNLLAVDLAIATLREQMRTGKANFEIVQLQLDELNDQRQECVRKMIAAAKENPAKTEN